MSYLSTLLGRLASVCLLLPLLAQAQGVFPPPEAAPDLRFEVSGSVNAIVPYEVAGEQFYVIAGSFNQVNGQPRSNLARLDVDGNLADDSWDSTWQAGTNGAVLALARDGNDLYLAGEFTAAGGQARGRAARFSLAGGALDPSFAPSLNAAAHSVQAGGGQVFFGGEFTAPRSLVAAYDIGGNLLTWDALIEGNTVFALHLDATNDRLYIGGTIRRIAGANRRGLGRVVASTAALETGGGAWVPGMQPAGGARVFAITGDATHIYVGGQFRRFQGGVNRNNAAKLAKASSAAVDAWDPNADAPVRSLVLDGFGFIYAGGEFSTIGGANRLRLAKLPSASPATAVASWSADADRAAVSLAMSTAGSVLAGGGFATVKGIGEGGIARLAAANGDPDPAFITTAGGPGRVESFAFDSAGGVIVGGRFDGIRIGLDPTYHARANLLRLNPDYSLDMDWTLGTFGDVLSLDVAQDQAGDRLYIGGRFTLVNGATPRARLALLDLDPVSFAASLNATWNPGANSEVSGLWHAAGQVYVAGLFTTAGGAARNFVAQLDAGGAGAASGWDPSPDDLVSQVLAVDADSVYLAGEFEIAGGLSRTGIARVNDSTGAANPDFNAALGAQAAASVVHATPNGLLLGGQFGAVGAELRGNLARVDALTGAVDAAWNPWAAGPGDRVATLAVDSVSGNVYVGGAFQQVGALSRSNLARISAAGVIDTGWEPGTDQSVQRITSLGADSVLISGGFSSVTGELRTGLARLGAETRDLTAITIDAIVPSDGVDGEASLVGQTYSVQWSLANLSNPGMPPAGSVLVSSSAGEACAPVAAAASGGCDLVATSSGARTISVSFSGDPEYQDAVATAPHLVEPAVVAFGLSVAPNPAGLSDEVIASITGFQVTTPGGGTPEGAFFVTIDGNAGCTILLPDLQCSLGTLGSFDFYDIEAAYQDSNSPANHIAEASALAVLAVGTPTSVSLSVPPTAVIGTPVTASVIATGLLNGEQVEISGGLGCTINIVDGEGDCQLSFDAAGEIGVIASYAGSDERLPFEDSATVTVSRIATSLALSADPAAPVIDQTVTIQLATSGIANGLSVAIDGAGAGCASVVVESNFASCTTSFAAAGNFLIEASFDATAEREASSDSLNLIVGKIPTSFSLQLSDATPTIGEPVTVSLLTPDLPIDALVAVSGGSGCSIDRSVSDSCTLSFSSAGLQSVSGVFTENATHLGSNASTDATVAKIITTLSLGADELSPQIGQSVLLTATTSNIPDGVSVSVSNAPGCTTITITANSGSCSTQFSAAGSVTVSVQFAETATHLASNASVEVDVQRIPVALQVSLDPAAPVVGQVVTVTLATDLPAGASVTIGGAPGCTAIQLPDTSCSTSFGAAGPVSLTADFAGDAEHTEAAANTNATVAKAATGFAAFAAESAVLGEGATAEFTWSVVVLAPGAGTPTGLVTVSDGNGLSCSAAVAAGTCSIAEMPAGAFEFNASYVGDDHFEAASSSSPAFIDVIEAIEPATDADLSVTMRVLGSAYFVEDDIELVQFEVLAGNAGPANALGAALQASIDGEAFQDTTWTCSPVAACSEESGVGNPSLVLDLADGEVATVLILATVRADAPSPALAEASITVPDGLDDPQLANNSATASYQTCSFSVVEGSTPDPLVLPVHLCVFRDSFEAQP